MTWEMAERWLELGIATLVERSEEHIVIRTSGEPLMPGEPRGSCTFTVYQTASEVGSCSR